MAKIFIEDTEIQDIADAIREKNGTENTYKPSEMPQAIKDIESGGGDSIDYTKYALTLTFDTSFEEITEDVYLDLSKVNTISNLFWNPSINCEKITLKISSLCGGMTNTFRTGGTGKTTKLKEVEIQGDTSSIINYQNAFYEQHLLQKIIGEFDCSKVTNFNNTFYNCKQLTTFTPKLETIKQNISFAQSPNLTLETIQSIIDGLFDLTESGASKILTLHATPKGKLTPDQIAQITNKNWTLA